MLPGSTNPIRKTTVTRCVHILPAADIPYWGPSRSDQLATTDPTSSVAGFPTLDFPWVPDLDSLHRMASSEVIADRWSNNPGLVFPSMDPLAMPEWNEEREVKVP